MEGPTAVFAAGNVLTGKGNIKDSLESGTEIGTHVAEATWACRTRKKIAEGARKDAAASAEKIAGAMNVRPKLAPEGVASLCAACANVSARSATRATIARGSRRSRRPICSSRLP